MQVILLKQTRYESQILEAGQVVETDDKTASRWIDNGIARCYVNKACSEEETVILSKKYLEPVNFWGYNDMFDHHALKKYLKHDKVSIVIPVFNALDYLKKCIETLVKFTQNYELIIIDNGSNNKTKKYLKELEDKLGIILQINENNKGFSYACNQGVKLSSCDYICFLNSDTVLTPNWLGKLMKGFEIKNAGILGPSSCYIAGEQCLSDLKDKRFKMELEDIIAVSLQLEEGYKETEVYGFCYLVKKEVFDKIGGFDYKTFGIGCGEENDFNRRARKLGYKTIWVKGSYVHHYGNRTFDEAKIPLTVWLHKNYSKFKEKEKLDDLFVENDVEITRKEKTDVVIVTLDRQEETIKTLQSLRANNDDLNIIIVDNGSDDISYLDKSLYDVLIQNKTNLGITVALNQGLGACRSKYIVVMHNDVVINTKNWVANCIEFMNKNADVGMCGLAGWTELNNGFYHGKLIASIDKYKNNPQDFTEVVVLDGVCNVIRNIGLAYDTNFGLMHGYDYDLSMQYHLQGYRRFVFPANAIHFAEDGNSTVENEKYKKLVKDNNKYRLERQKLFFDKWSMFLPLKVGDERIIRLDIGCGTNKKEGFIGIDKFDYSDKYGRDFICGNVPEVLKTFKDNSVDEIFTSNFIEHLRQDDVIEFFNEVYRMLKKGHTIEIIVPTTDNYGAFCDPTHRSFFNSYSWRYYDKTWNESLSKSYGIKANFEIIKNEKINDIEIRAVLKKR